jgi:C-methyltransferase C-terminal domain/Putative zinc binding domain/Methyltransferase domain
MRCRSCDSENLRPVISLGGVPPVNNLLSSATEKFERFPLDVIICEECSLAQLKDTVPPEAMFQEYLFYSSVMAPVVESANKLVEKVTSKRDLSQGLVIEIASNDGYLLDFYKRKGINILGVDPAVGPANASALKGIPTIQSFFTLALAKTLPKADVIHANNVLAHVPTLNDFVAGIAEVLKSTGIAIIEVPYLGDLLRGCHFDTIYHEHVFYFSIKSLTQLFNRHGLNIMDVEHLPNVLGGSLRVTVGRGKSHCEMEEHGLDQLDTLQDRAIYKTTELKKILLQLKAEGKIVWGFGAAAKTTVFMNCAGIDSTLIEAVVDDTPAKQGKYIPGTGVQVRTSQDWLKVQPDYTFIFIWNYAQVISHKFCNSYKGQFFTSDFPPNMTRDKSLDALVKKEFATAPRGPKVLIAFLGWVGGAKRGDHQALRDTWLKDLPQFPNIDYRFFIGDGTPVDPQEDEKINAGFIQWANAFKGGNKSHYTQQTNLGKAYPVAGYEPREDEVMVSCPDGYHYMSYKRKESLRWALEHGYDYIFCLSNDVYARPERLLSSEFQRYDYHGMFCGNSGFVGTDCHIPESYIFGGGYWLSAKAARVIVNSKVTYWCEDWWIGMALSQPVKQGEIIRNDAPLNVSKYAIAPRLPNVGNDIISVELSAGNYDKAKMYACHTQFSNPVPVQTQTHAPYRYDRSGLVVDWWSRHSR